MIRMLILGGLALGSTAAFAAANTDSQYELKRVGTPRGERFVLVHVDRDSDRAPYALTGADERSGEPVVRFMGPRHTPRVIVQD